ncbi:NAD-dependent deacylase [Candidatus Chloroploca sp. M-50]|uniref:NAD-dependent protein deacylase n=1 Tax=Candidatus Chloroploca mongolica TaxID=2528176 RepID=A0ABS4D822_9CHLR|nr:NAD-dependent deacylase [Candidatus Chloroploca mongolica]MBP1465564.1 NAD-dependent deacylase [Candidatus Chloroploca mongolica]
MSKEEPAIPNSLLEALRTAQHVVVLTGAGISAESGIPTFRDAQTGLWAQYSAEELATPEAFQRNPRLVWDWYAWRRQTVAAARPNAGHLALARLETLVPTFTLITQNVDGLHAAAGSREPIELHGNIMRVRCALEATRYTTWSEDGTLPPPCPTCGAPLRPDVVWFGEQLPVIALERAWAAAATCDVMLSIGTSGLVEPAASLPRLAYNRGATVAVLNLDVTPHNEERLYLLNGQAGSLLPALVAALEQKG